MQFNGDTTGHFETTLQQKFNFPKIIQFLRVDVFE